MKISRLTLISLYLATSCSKDGKTKEILVKDPAEQKQIEALAASDRAKENTIQAKDREIAELSKKVDQHSDDSFSSQDLLTSIKATLAESLRGVPEFAAIQLRIEEAVEAALKQAPTDAELQDKILDAVRTATEGSRIADILNQKVDEALKNTIPRAEIEETILKAFDEALEEKGNKKLVERILELKKSQKETLEKNIAKAIREKTAGAPINDAVLARIAEETASQPGEERAKIEAAIKNALDNKGDAAFIKLVADAIEVAKKDSKSATEAAIAKAITEEKESGDVAKAISARITKALAEATESPADLNAKILNAVNEALANRGDKALIQKLADIVTVATTNGATEVKKNIAEAIRKATAEKAIEDAVLERIKAEVNKVNSDLPGAISKAVEGALKGEGDKKLVEQITKAIVTAKEESRKKAEEDIAKAIVEKKAEGAIADAVAKRIAAETEAVDLKTRIIAAVDEALNGRGDENIRDKIEQAIKDARSAQQSETLTRVIDSIKAASNEFGLEESVKTRIQIAIDKSRSDYIRARQKKAAERFVKYLDRKAGVSTISVLAGVDRDDDGEEDTRPSDLTYFASFNEQKPCELTIRESYRDAKITKTYKFEVASDFVGVIDTRPDFDDFTASIIVGLIDNSEEIPFTSDVDGTKGEGKVGGISFKFGKLSHASGSLGAVTTVQDNLKILVNECSFKQEEQLL